MPPSSRHSPSTARLAPVSSRRASITRCSSLMFSLVNRDRVANDDCPRHTICLQLKMFPVSYRGPGTMNRIRVILLALAMALLAVHADAKTFRYAYPLNPASLDLHAL